MEKRVTAPFVEPTWDETKTYRNFGTRPIRFRSKNSMRKYCKDHKVSSGALL